MKEDGGVRMGVGLRIRMWISGGSGRGSGVVTEEFWEVGIMEISEGCAGDGVESRGGALCGRAKSEDVGESTVVTERGNLGGVRCVGGGGAVFTAIVKGEATSVGEGEGGAFGGGASI